MEAILQQHRGAEIDHAGLPGVGEHQVVLGFEIAMGHAARVKALQRLEQRREPGFAIGDVGIAIGDAMDPLQHEVTAIDHAEATRHAGQTFHAPVGFVLAFQGGLAGMPHGAYQVFSAYIGESGIQRAFVVKHGGSPLVSLLLNPVSAARRQNKCRRSVDVEQILRRTIRDLIDNSQSRDGLFLRRGARI